MKKAVFFFVILFYFQLVYCGDYLLYESFVSSDNCSIAASQTILYYWDECWVNPRLYPLKIVRFTIDGNVCIYQDENAPSRACDDIGTPIRCEPIKNLNQCIKTSSIQSHRYIVKRISDNEIHRYYTMWNFPSSSKCQNSPPTPKVPTNGFGEGDRIIFKDTNGICDPFFGKTKIFTDNSTLNTCYHPDPVKICLTENCENINLIDGTCHILEPIKNWYTWRGDKGVRINELQPQAENNNILPPDMLTSEAQSVHVGLYVYIMNISLCMIYFFFSFL